MAVPGRGRRNGLMEEDENEDDNALFEADGVLELESLTPPHLQALAAASELGDVHALRIALGTSPSSSSSSSPPLLLDFLIIYFLLRPNFLSQVDYFTFSYF